MSRIVAWTGHRPDLFREPNAARATVEQVMRDLAGAGAERCLVGGQRGVDTWAAQSAVSCALPLTLILPFHLDEFTRDWAPTDRQLLEQTLGLATEVSIAGGYRERNRRLATGGDLLVAVWTRTFGGGTAETIELARAAGTPIREIVLEPSSTAASASGRGI
jgi:hypothetical protein